MNPFDRWNNQQDVVDLDQWLAQQTAGRQQPARQQPKSNKLADTLLSLVPFGTITQKALTGRGGEITPGEIGLEAALTLLPFGRLAKGAKTVAGLGKAAKGAEAAVPAGTAPLLYKTGQRLTEKAGGLQIGKDVGDITKVEEATALFTRHGITGNPRQQLQKIQTTMGKLGKEVDTRLAAAPVKLSGAAVRKEIDTILQDKLKFAGLELRDKKVSSALKEHKATIAKLGGAKEINDYIKRLNPIAQRAQGKVFRGVVPTSDETAILAIKKAGDELVATKVPGIAPFKKDMAILFERNPEVTQLANKGAAKTPPILGTQLPIPRGLLAGAESKAGQFISAGGGPSAPARIGRNFAGQAGRRAAVKPFVGGEQPAARPLGLEDTILQQAGPGTPGTGDEFGAAGSFGGEQQPEQSPYSRENLSADIQRDPENAAKYIDFYKNLQEDFAAAGPKLSAPQQKGLLQARNAASLVDQLETAYQALGGGQGRIGGGLRSAAAAAGFDNPVDYYNQVRASTASILARAFGEVGTMTDQDIKRAVSRLPKVTDTPEVASQKLQDVKQLIGSVYQNTLQTGGSTNSSLEEAVLTAGGYQ